HLDISQHFVGEGTRAVPVGDPAKRKDDLTSMPTRRRPCSP
ncbi:unnamed protein product, partial [Pylaiella littoralis]